MGKLFEIGVLSIAIWFFNKDLPLLPTFVIVTILFFMFGALEKRGKRK